MATQTIQVVLDRTLLKAADRAAQRGKTNRSALIRQALRDHLKKLRIAELEERERIGYQRVPDDRDEFADLRAVTTWPDD